MTVHVIATGGTISSHWDGEAWGNLDGAALIDELGALPVEVTVADVASGPSANLSTDDMVAIARRVADALDSGARGVVVTHGTDTMELTAFVVQLLLGTSEHRRPVVFTGSMRVHSHAAPDGPRNLRDAIDVAASEVAVGHDVLVCLEGSLHSARAVHKHTAASVDAFHSLPSQPMGTVHRGQVDLAARPPSVEPAPGLAGPVPLLTCYPGIEAEHIEAVLQQAVGVVVEGFGDLNLPAGAWQPLHRAVRRGAAVLVASAAFTPNRGADLVPFGAAGAGGLPAQKARLALMAGLAGSSDPASAFEFVHRYSHAHDFGDRSSS